MKIPSSVTIVKFDRTVVEPNISPTLVGTFDQELLQQCKNPIDFFNKIVTDEYLSPIALQTSTKAYGEEGSNTIRSNDIRMYIGMNYLLDCYPFIQYMHAFGKKKSIFKSDLIDNCVDLNRYQKVKKYISMPNNDAMYLMNLIRDQVQHTYNSFTHLCLDEMLRRFQGRFRFKHRIVSKPARIGIKYFILGCSISRVPFLFKFNDNNLSPGNGLTKIGNVVYEMIKEFLLTQSHIQPDHELVLFLDNYFTSHQLLVKLKELNVGCVGTFKTNMIPQEVKAKGKVWIKDNRKRIYNNDHVHCPRIIYLFEGVYYCYVVDNGVFCLATNSKKMIDQGIYYSSRTV